MRLSILTAIGYLLWLAHPALAQEQPSTPAASVSNAIVIPRAIPDPLEPVNRGIWSFNTVVNNFLLHPVGEGYRFIVRKPLRDKINNFARNLNYPGRLINHALQGRWKGAHQETRRFAVNTVLGIGGFFDPATHFGIEKSDASFGQTFGRWGWKPGMYFVIPILGPSSERDGIGLIGDIAVHPLVYYSPYNYALYGLSFNYLVDNTAELKRLTESGTDSYAYARQASAYVRENDVSEFRITEMPKEPAMTSLNAIFFSHSDPDFPERADTRSARIPTTGGKLKYSLWLQKNKDGTPAPLVYIMPGLGGQRLQRPSLALAELVYSQGASVVTVSSVFNAEFFEAASSVAVPGYAAVDSRDLHVALDAIDRDLQGRYGGRIGRRALLGFSMGGFQTLKIAARNGGEPSHLIRFDRYIAINPPVDLMHGLDALDRFYDAALHWPAGERTARIDHAFRKVAYLVTKSSESQDQPASAAPPMLPFDRIESGFLIGYSYRTILRDIIYSTQYRQNLGVLREPVRKFRRQAVYEEIYGYSYADYLNYFVIPYYQGGGGGVATAGATDVAIASDLRNYTPALRRAPDLRLILSADDFLLKDGDLSWLKSLTPAPRVTVFGNGGHMGHLADDAGKRAVSSAISDL